MSKDIELTPEQEVAKLRQELADEKKAHENTRQEAEELINSAQSQVAEAQEQVERQALVVSHGKDKYAITAKVFKFKGKEYKAEDLKKNGELVETLVNAGSHLLVKVKK